MCDEQVAFDLVGQRILRPNTPPRLLEGVESLLHRLEWRDQKKAPEGKL